MHVEMRKKEYLSMVLGDFLGHPRNLIGMVIAYATLVPPGVFMQH